MKTEDYFKNNQMAIDIFNAKYAFDKENGEKENVLEVFTRVARNLAVYESEPEKWEKIWIDDMMEGWYRPGGSILSGVGSKSVISLANCFSADTQFITERGTKCFSDFKDGDKVKVLTRYGSYKQGTIRKHGEQEIVFLTLRQNSIKKTIKTTADHLWFTGSNFVEKETRYLIARPDEKADSIPVVRKRLIPEITDEDFLNNSPKKNPRRDVWFVDKIEFTGKTEMVWCINEPETNSFVLEDGILTHNCTTIPLSEDSIQGINKCVSDMMLCAAKRQGLGVDVSVLRPKGAKVNNAANESTGAIPWMDYLQSMGNYVGQAGRRPAVLLSIKCNHPDVIEFIKSKTDLNLIQNANISVQITDAFMEAVIEDNDWELYFETKHEIISKIVRAKDIFSLISESAHVSAEPGVQFIDLMRKGSMIHQIYLAIGDKRFCVVSTNACCFVETTNVLTVDGMMKISEIRKKIEKGEDVLVYSFNIHTGKNEIKPVIDCFPRNNGEPVQTISIELENGKSIECTPDHKFMTQHGWVKATDLEELYDELSGVDDNETIKIKNKTKNKKKQVTWNITVADNHNYYVEGVLVKNSEKPLAPYGICLLGSINMGMFPNNPMDYGPILYQKTQNLIRLLDNAIQYEIDNDRYGVPEQRDLAKLTREVGMGITNLHQWFLNADIQYDSKEAIKASSEFMEYYAMFAFQASQELAEEKGPAGAYELGITAKDLMGSSFFNNVIHSLELENNLDEVKPLRNLALLSIAPTGSVSMTFPEGCISSGLEPIFAPAYWRKTRAISKNDWEYYFVMPSGVKSYLMTKIPSDSEDYSFLESLPESIKDDSGDHGKKAMKILKTYLGEGFFKAAHEIDPFMKLEMMAGMYKFIDAAASVTYNLPEDCTVETIESLYMKAWEQGVRAVSVYREGSREGILVFTPPDQQKEKRVTYCNERPNTIQFNCAPKRPKDVSCDIHHAKVMGKDWIVLVGIHEGFPYEIFAGEANKEEMYVPQSAKQGILRKDGRKYSLIVPIKKSDVEYKDIANLFMNERYRSTTRLISLALRHGVRPAFIIDQLKKADEGITEFSSVVTRVLGKYMKALEFEYLNKKDGDSCPFCGSTDWIYQGSCKVCAVCSKGSKCD